MRGATREYAGRTARGKSFVALQSAKAIGHGDASPSREESDENVFDRAWRLHRHSWRGRLAIRLMVWAVRLHSGAVTAITIDLARNTPLERILAARLNGLAAGSPSAAERGGT